jgi:oligopeptide/dipeptide ABC transporter ATP-binding protein
MKPILETKNLCKFFPVNRGIFGIRGKSYVHAVDSVDLIIEEGETIGIVGESGSGKSTLAQLFVKLLSPTNGTILFHGKDIFLNPKSNQEYSQRVQYMFQDSFSSLNPRLRVGDLLREPFDIYSLSSGDELIQRIKDLLELIGLEPHHLSRFPHQLSGGQKQRVVLARILALNPEIIILDEPVSDLDVSIKAQIINLLIDMQEHFKSTFIYVSHDLSILHYVCDRIVVMYSGQIIEIALTTKLYSSPQHPYSEGLISSVPLPDPKRKRRKSALNGEIQTPIDPPDCCRFAKRCNFSRDMCFQQIPELEIIDDNHHVRCFFPARNRSK